MAPKYELTYFPVRGRGSMARIFLEDQGIEYKYTQVDPKNWAQVKPTLPFGQLPTLTVNGSDVITQSHAILRFLAREQGLMGSNSLETARIEMYIDQCADVRKKLLAMIYQDYEAGKQPYIESIPAELAPFQKILEASSDKQFLLGKLTAADYVLFDLLLVLVALSPNCLAQTPAVQAFFNSFAARPKLQAFLNKPEVKSMQFTGSGHL